MHYESRLLKLRHLHAEHALNREKYKVRVLHSVDSAKELLNVRILSPKCKKFETPKFTLKKCSTFCTNSETPKFAVTL